MNDRLLALATEMAKRNHNGIYPGHDEDDFATCPHPDCAAVRAGAALPPQPEICICAAVRMDDGTIFRGHRHDDCILTAGKRGYRTRQEHQGFVTSRNRFVDREEGAALQNAAGIVSADHGHGIGSLLFSEDLYSTPAIGPSFDPLPRVGVWRDIESAPKDMNEVLLYWPFQTTRPLIGARNYRNGDDGGSFIVYEDSWWVDYDRFMDDSTDPGPTHWMPLPTPPLAGGA